MSWELGTDRIKHSTAMSLLLCQLSRTPFLFFWSMWQSPSCVPSVTISIKPLQESFLGPLRLNGPILPLVFRPVDEPKFVCLMDREAKQTKMSESEAEKGLLLGRARRTDRSCLKSPKSPTILKEKISFFSFSWPCQAVCGSLSSDQEWNSCPLHWKRGVLTTGPLGKSWGKSFNGQILGGGGKLQGMWPSSDWRVVK